MQGSSAYSSLLKLGHGDYLVQYDRLANGWSPPEWQGKPGAFGGRDHVFAMRLTLADQPVIFEPPVKVGVSGEPGYCYGIDADGRPAGLQPLRRDSNGLAPSRLEAIASAGAMPSPSRNTVT